MKNREVLVTHNNKRIMLSSPFPTDTTEGGTFEQFMASNSLNKSATTTSPWKGWVILQCTSEIEDPKDFLLWFARCIDLPSHTEALRVVKNATGVFTVLYLKNGQRKEAVTGVLARYTLPNCGRHSRDEQKANLIRSMDEMKGTGYSMLLEETLDESSALDVVATCRNLSRHQLVFMRLQAFMKKPKDVTPFERSITGGWRDLCELLEGRKDCGGAWIYLDDPSLRWLSSYGDDSNGYHFFDHMGIECEYGAADGAGGLEWQPSTLHELMTTSLHQKRTILITGPPESGKSVLGSGIASQLTFMYDADTPQSELGFGFFRSVEIAKKHTDKMGRRKVVLFDDVKAASARRKDTDLGDFLLNMLDIERATQPCCRNTDLHFPAGLMRIFTTNVTAAEFLTDRNERVPTAQLDSLYRRLFVIKLTKKMYTPAEALERGRIDDEELQEALARQAAARKEGRF